MKGELLHILLVEDNEDHAELVLRNFADNHIANKIFHVRDGEEALDYLLHRGSYAQATTCPTPNLVLLDLRLPKIDGLEVLREIKGNPLLQAIPVVVLTSSAAEKDVAMAYSAHANSYLVKPVDFDKFMRLMKDLGFYWLGWNVNPLS